MEICIDFDGTCVKHAYPKVGEDIGSQKTLKQLVANGHKLILFTMRSGKELDDAVKWFEQNNIPLYGINKNPTQSRWTKSPKAYGQLYIDDAALGTPLIYHFNNDEKSLSERPYVDWTTVSSWLYEMGLIN